MARVRQFANYMGMSYNQAKELINKGRKLSDGGSSILEKVKMTSKKDKEEKNKKKKFEVEPVKPFFEVPEGMEEEFNPRGGGRGVRPVKAAKGKFPDLSGDGKTTMKDILIGRGVIEKPVKASAGRYQSKAGEFRGCGAQLSGKKFKGVF